MANDERVFWRRLLAGAIAAAFVIVLISHAVSSVDDDDLASPKFWALLAWRFFSLSLPIGGLLWLLYSVYSTAIAMFAAGAVGNDADRSSVIAKGGGFLRNLFLKPEQTTEYLERLRLEQGAKSKSPNDAELPPASPPPAALTPPVSVSATEAVEPDNEPDKPVADKKIKAAKKQKANRPRK